MANGYLRLIHRSDLFLICSFLLFPQRFCDAFLWNLLETTISPSIFAQGLATDENLSDRLRDLITLEFSRQLAKYEVCVACYFFDSFSSHF
jgi:hypothetical protein